LRLLISEEHFEIHHLLKRLIARMEAAEEPERFKNAWLEGVERMSRETARRQEECLQRQQCLLLTLDDRRFLRSVGIEPKG